MTYFIAGKIYLEQNVFFLKIHNMLLLIKMTLKTVLKHDYFIDVQAYAHAFLYHYSATQCSGISTAAVSFPLNACVDMYDFRKCSVGAAAPRSGMPCEQVQGLPAHSAHFLPGWWWWWRGRRATSVASLPGTLAWHPARNLSPPPPPSASLPALSGDLRPLHLLLRLSGADLRGLC